MSATVRNRNHCAILYITCLLNPLLVCAAISERLRHTINSIKYYKGSPTAVIAARNAGDLLSDGHFNLTISLTMWTCPSVNSSCYQSFKGYVTQSDPFPKPSFVIAPWQNNLPEGIFGDVRRLDVSDPNVYWVFAVDDHLDVDAFLSNHTCQVITVTEKDIGTPADGYKSCNVRLKSSELEWKSVLGYPELARTYPRDGRLIFALHEDKTTPPECANMGPMFFLAMALSSVQVRAPEEAALLDAYDAVNTSLRMHCANERTGEALLQDKDIDFILYSWFKKNSTSVSEYKYAFYTPSSLCFYSRAGTPVRPSLTDSWTFVLSCVICLAPLSFAIVLLFHAEGTICPSERVAPSSVVMVLVSSLLGRSPQSLNIKSSTLRVLVVMWLLGMFIAGNHLQSSVTASRSVPEFSAEIRTKEQLLTHLNEEITAPCTARFNHEMRGRKDTEPVFEPLAESLKKCKSGCLDEFGFGCLEKASRRTHIYFATCTEVQRRVTLKHALVVGDNALAAWQGYSAVHSRYPFRYQHKRLMMAVSESGIWMHYGSRYPMPSVNDDTVSFDMTLRDYLTALYAGLTLSLVVFLFEILLHRYRRQDRVAAC